MLQQNSVLQQNPAFVFFRGFRDDIDDLIAIHDSISKKRKPNTDGQKSGRNIDVLRRAGLILLVTAWETFVEDILRMKFGERLQAAASPDDIGPTVNAVAHAWLEETRKNGKTINPPDLLLWSGDGWKKLVSEKFESDINSFNTPKSDKIRPLFKRYLDVPDITQNWNWQNTTSADACKELDSIVGHRGALVHRGESMILQKPVSVPPDVLIKAVKLIDCLAKKTAGALGHSEFEPVT